VGHTDVNIINVGAGSCAVIESPSGHNSMIDINDGSDLRETASMSFAERFVHGDRLRALAASVDDPIDFCKRYRINELFRFVLSHPDADHMAGLRRILRDGELPVTNFWDIPHKRTHEGRADFKTDAAYEDWLAYQSLRDGTLPAAPKLISPLRGDSRDFWWQDGIEIISPTAELISDCDDAASDSYNNSSYVLRVNHGPSSVLLPGDVEDKAWNDMLDAGIDLSADVLVASHHGRKSGYNEEALKAIDPTIVIISTDRLDPAHDAEDDYRRYTHYVYSTRDLGSMWVRMHDDGSFALHNANGQIVGFVRTNAA
jgi:beta-lactamase superfamily II metal-dependent hydrolase